MNNSAKPKSFVVLFLIIAFSLQTAFAGLSVTNTSGLRFTGADGIDYFGVNGMRFTGADGFLNTQVNGMRFTGADGTRFTGADGTRFTGADGVTFTGTNGMRFTGADGMRFTGADGARFTGADGYRFTGADGTTLTVNSIYIVRPNGAEIIRPASGALVGLDGFNIAGTNGSAIFADGMRLTGADGVRFTGADSVTGFNSAGAVFNYIAPGGFSITGPDGARFTGADAAFTQVNGIRLTGADGIRLTGADGNFGYVTAGLQSVDPRLAIILNQATDDSTVNAVVTFHNYPTATDLDSLAKIGIVGGTQFKVLPFIYISATRQQIAAVSQLPNVRSIYGNRTLNFDSDPYFKATQISRVSTDRDLQARPANVPYSGKNITVAVLDTGVNSQHNDLSGKVLQNVKLADTQSAAVGFINPTAVENLPDTDLLNGHGTFVAGVIAATGVSSGGKYSGVAPGASILGLSVGDVNLISVLSGFDYLLEKSPGYRVRVVNCSFSSDTVFDFNDPVNIATKMLTDNNINVVFSAGNSGSGNSSLNPYAAAPWVVSVGATDEKGVLADFSSRGVFGDPQFSPSLVAPGVNVVSLRNAATQTGTLGLAGTDAQRLSPAELPFYTTDSGTSFSAPQVAGAIALMLEANPNLRPAQIKNILQRSATPLPNYFTHEVGAGMLNTYAAVLEAAFPMRRTGVFRGVLNGDSIQYLSSITQNFSGSVNPDTAFSTFVNIPANTIQSNVYIAWGGLTNPNDLSLKLTDSNGNSAGQSNYVNAADVAGRNEKITNSLPAAGIWKAIVENSYSAATAQDFQGLVEITQLQFGSINDLSSMSVSNQSIALESLRKFILTPDGSKFSPQASITRADLAAAIIRAGKSPQYVAMNQAFTDVSDLTRRNAVESAQFNPNGKLFYDAGTSGEFRPNQFVTRLTAAVALIKASQLDSAATSTALPLTVADASTIPTQWRGYAALALQKGWLSLENGKFNPNNPVNRFDSAKMLLSK